ncbi:methionyl-tRNA formyltransferase [Actinomadura roseirufa]|uniref:methionyl-tRNA formyltransferase n=1 Tax=Actinomadura roseirufa TaxID=2094049 RepID=UPI0010413BD3|nr:formyltransferase family protein [Actinomadura roseirufa]
MSDKIRVAIASYGAEQFSLLNGIIQKLGHEPVVYLMSRSMRPHSTPEPDVLSGVTATIPELPPDIGLLLPSGPVELQPMLGGHKVDLLLVFGFNWRIPAEVLGGPRYGVLNVHPSLLPRYRGPSPIPWAVRNGDAELGVTVHRMTERIDAGPILTQGVVGRIPDRASPADTWNLVRTGLPALLEQAITMALAGVPGVEQAEESATYAGFPPPEWEEITWEQGRLDAHHQVRVYRFLHRGSGPVVEIGGRRIRILDTSVVKEGGLVVECADGPLWITDHEPV